MLDLPLRTLLSDSALRSLFLLPILSIFILLVSRLFCSWNFFCYSSRSKSVAGDSRLVFNVVRVPVGVSSSLNERIARSTTMRWASFSSDCSSFFNHFRLLQGGFGLVLRLLSGSPVNRLAAHRVARKVHLQHAEAPTLPFAVLGRTPIKVRLIEGVGRHSLKHLLGARHGLDGGTLQLMPTGFGAGE
jgi:hypothetical protein